MTSLGKTGDGTHMWWLNKAHTWKAVRMGDGKWIPHEVTEQGDEDHGHGPFDTLKRTREWWRTSERNPDR
jgi:hypothetical protein